MDNTERYMTLMYLLQKTDFKVIPFSSEKDLGDDFIMVSPVIFNLMQGGAEAVNYVLEKDKQGEDNEITRETK